MNQSQQTALYRRRLQFRSGPESYVFHACEKHRRKLGEADHISGRSQDDQKDTSDVLCFFGHKNDKVEAVDPDDEETCDFCREG